VHRNILRDATSLVYGNLLGDEGNIIVGEVYENEYTYHINNTWLAHHCHTIAFIGSWDVSYIFIDIVQIVELEIKTSFNLSLRTKKSKPEL